MAERHDIIAAGTAGCPANDAADTIIIAIQMTVFDCNVFKRNITPCTAGDSANVAALAEHINVVHHQILDRNTGKSAEETVIRFDRRRRSDVVRMLLIYVLAKIRDRMAAAVEAAVKGSCVADGLPQIPAEVDISPKLNSPAIEPKPIFITYVGHVRNPGETARIGDSDRLVVFIDHRVIRCRCLPVDQLRPYRLRCGVGHPENISFFAGKYMNVLRGAKRLHSGKGPVFAILLHFQKRFVCADPVGDRAGQSLLLKNRGKSLLCTVEGIRYDLGCIVRGNTVCIRAFGQQLSAIASIDRQRMTIQLDFEDPASKQSVSIFNVCKQYDRFAAFRSSNCFLECLVLGGVDHGYESASFNDPLFTALDAYITLRAAVLGDFHVERAAGNGQHCRIRVVVCKVSITGHGDVVARAHVDRSAA